MNTLTDCCTPCAPSTPPVNVPGAVGNTGQAGINGINGIDAFSILAANFTTPLDTVTPITISVSSSLWMVVGETIMIGQGAGVAIVNPGPGTFKVTAIPSPTQVTVTFMHLTGDVGFNTIISAGAVVSGVGQSTITLPVAIGNGGTGATTKATAQTGLGLGQDAVISTSTGLTQAITASFVQVGAIDVQIPAAGTWFFQGVISVDMNGVTFVANRTITVKLRNVTQGVDLASAVRHTQIQATTNFPTYDWYVQFIQDATGVANDHYQLLVTIDIVNSAGTLQVTAGSLSATPLRKS